MTTRRGHSTPRALARALSIVSLTLPVGATLALGTAPAALASSASFSSPSANQVVSDPSTTSVPVKASVTLSPGQTVTLTVTGPGYSGNQSTGKNTTLFNQSKSLSVSAAVHPATEPNGRFTASLSGDVSAKRYFFTDFGPTATPAGVTAQATNPAPGSTTGTIDLSWTYGGTEPDLAGFRVADGNGWTADLSASDAGCSGGGTCHHSKSYDNAPGSTQSYSFTVAALRTSCTAPSSSSDARADGCSSSSGPVVGTASNAATAQLVTPEPPPSPTPGPSASGSPAPGGTTGGTTGGTSGGSTPPTPGGLSHTDGSAGGSSGAKPPAIVVPTLNPVVAQRKAFALGFNTFSPSLGIPKLPPLPATTFPETVGAASENTYQPTLPYKAQPAHTTTSFFASPLGAVRSLDTQQLARSLAAALILLVTAAHVRLFLNAHRPD